MSTPYDEEFLVSQLINDEIFRESIESELGKLVRIYPDWKSDHLVYEFLNGKSLYSNLSGIIKQLKDMDYLKDSLH